MLLRPRKTTFKTLHKKRSLKTLNFHSLKLTKQNHPNLFKSKNIIKLVYGQFGFLNQNPNYLIFSKFLLKLKLFLKKAVRRSNITNRFLWFKIFPHIPITKKVIGSRMGKGKGKQSNWAAKIPHRYVFIELRNLRVGRARYFFSQIKYKLPGSYKLITKYDYFQYNTLAFRKSLNQYGYNFN